MLKNPLVVVRNVIFKLPLFYVDHIQKSIYQNREFYEIETLNHIKNEFPQIRHVIDIGSNIGNHVLFYCSEMNVESVICFEPNLLSRECLFENVQLNGFSNKVRIEACALGEKASKGLEVGYSRENTGMNKIVITENTEEEFGSIEIKSLDDYDFSNIELMKIDVEGFELNVLKGAFNTIIQNRPIVLIEVFNDNKAEVCRYFEELGYKLYSVLEEYNLLFVPIKN
jgi:FkbM family methyltransferase